MPYCLRKEIVMALFKKKPIVIEAVKVLAPDYDGNLWDGPAFSEFTPWLKAAYRLGTVTPLTVDGAKHTDWRIQTLEGEMLARPGDYIIQGVKGELYPCAGDIFEMTYDSVAERVKHGE
jgi:hypothetical protein